jgi:hypothetical protein
VDFALVFHNSLPEIVKNDLEFRKYEPEIAENGLEIGENAFEIQNFAVEIAEFALEITLCKSSEQAGLAAFVGFEAEFFIAELGRDAALGSTFEVALHY